MKRLTISFFILAGLLFVGIALMIKPSAFVHSSEQNQSSFTEKPEIERSFLTIIIISGSILTIIGLIGLSIMGFYAFKEINRQETR